MGTEMRLQFSKLHGLGNDFVVIDARDLRVDFAGELARRLCDRHTGIGADGLLLFTGSVELPRMTVVNADGSVPEMCGNGLRCFVKWFGDGLRCNDAAITVETGSGPLRCTIARDSAGAVASVAVAMGHATWQPEQVPVLAEAPLVNSPFEVGGVTLQLSALATGNPHAVTFDALSRQEVQRLGPLLSSHRRFPAGVNAEFARVIVGPTGPEIVVDVHERGCGWTQACGTGATATVLAAVALGLVPRDTEIVTHLPGGWLGITVDAIGAATMRGPAVTVFDGALEVPSV